MFRVDHELNINNWHADRFHLGRPYPQDDVHVREITNESGFQALYVIQTGTPEINPTNIVLQPQESTKARFDPSFAWVVVSREPINEETYNHIIRLPLTQAREKAGAGDSSQRFSYYHTESPEKSKAILKGLQEGDPSATQEVDNTNRNGFHIIEPMENSEP
ncbi:hypothetical protein PGT21_017788 [Puccinia graminis f. sp. tritici]|uniref:Uncharacterized protein n=1 Tax=Puccinia graminis f. sp. tritici TaxID=56615 RepID=A0A5B0NCE2_PUCGR|nr:hypothetical protein PGT21_017788 [Puccinia graminis f. sp. tritici]